MPAPAKKKAVKKSTTKKAEPARRTRSGREAAPTKVSAGDDAKELAGVRAKLERARRQREAVERKGLALDTADIELAFAPMPDIKNPKRREQCAQDLERYLRTYHPDTYSRPFSAAHKKFIGKLQESMTASMWLVQSVFRGFGKTSITEGAVAWALNNGHKRFPVVVAASSRHSSDIIKSIKTEYESNDLLYEDYPEICHAVRALEGRAQRCNAQRWNGEPTYIGWSADHLVIPRTRPGYASAGSTVYACGWTSSLRGLKHKVPWSGEMLRPDFVMIDDPQDDELAQSPDQVRRLLDVIQGAIIGLGGHKTRISVAILATVIQVSDAIDRMMDAREYPAWIAENVPMLMSDPEDMGLWLTEYARIRSDFDRDNPKAQAAAASLATEYYRTNREAMDKGAVATWRECHNDDDEISAIQHAMNIRIDRGEDYFQSECQGKPRSRLGGGAFVVDPDVICRKTSGLKRRIVPAEAVGVTGFIDVGHKKLNWALTAYRGDMSSSIIDYGEYPEGTRTLEDLGDETLTAAVFRGLVNTIELMAGSPLLTTDGGDRLVGDILIDCGDPSTRDAVFQVCRAQRFPCRVLPSRGRAHHMFKLPDPRKKRVFQNAYLDIWKGLGPVVVHDACIWRERFQRGLATGQGGPGCVDIYGTADMLHREFATQLTSERLVEKLAGASGEVFKWTRVPGTQNHYLDCAVGCMVAATVEGLRYGSEIATIQTARQRKASASASGNTTDGRTSHSTAGAFNTGRPGARAGRKRGGFRTLD